MYIRFRNLLVMANVKFKLFFVFLLITSLFWLLINLSKEYTSEVTFDVTYIDLPTDLVFQSEPVSEISLDVTAKGFTLLKYKTQKRKLEISFEQFQKGRANEYYYLPNKDIKKLKVQLNSARSIDRTIRDTIFFYIGMNASKYVPVVLKSDIKYKLGYNAVGDFSITPDSIEVSGPESVLDSITHVNTLTLVKNELNTDIDEAIGIEVLPNSNLIFSQESVQVNLKIDKITEGQLQAPFEIVNLPDGYTITTFPSEVKIVYNVGLSNFNKISSENFKVTCDFALSDLNGVNYLIPEVSHQPALVSNVRVIPSKIEFLIEE